MDEDPRSAQADLALIREGAAHDVVHGGVEIGILADYDGILPSEFEGDPLEHRSRDARDGLAGLGRTGEGDGRHIGVFDDALPHRGAGPVHQIECSGEARLDDQLAEHAGGDRGHLARLGDHGVPGGERGCDLPGQEVEGEVPGRDAAGHAACPSQGVVDRLAVHLMHFAGEGLDRTRGVAEVGGGAWDLDLGRLGEGLPLILGLEARKSFGVVVDQVGELAQQGGSLTNRTITPDGKRLGRGGDGAIDVLGSGVGKVGEHSTGRGVDRLASFATEGIDQSAVDEIADVVHVRLTPWRHDRHRRAGSHR